MPGTVVLCEKSSQASNIRAAVGGRFGEVVAAQGHLLELVEPQEMRAEWKSWTDELLHPGEPYPTKPIRTKQAILGRVRKAIRGADTVIVATDQGREGHLIGMEIVEHLEFRGEVLRANFNKEDPESIREAFGRLEDAGRSAGLLAAGKARQQADQICNLTLTRAATKLLAPEGRGALGIGRVRTPTLAIICRRENEITTFVPETRWIILADITTGSGAFTAACRRAPGTREPITDRATAETIAAAMTGWRGPVTSGTKAGSRGPPAPHDLAALQAEAGRLLKWTAKRTLEVAQQLYSDLKLITYPRVDARVWPEAMAAEAGELRPAVCRLLDGSREAGEPVVRSGRTRACQFSDARLEGHEHHAIAPNPRTIAEFPQLWGRCTDDQRRLAAIILRRYAAITAPDWTFTTLTLSLEADTPAGLALFSASGKSTTDPGWTAWERPPPDRPKDGEEDTQSELPRITSGDPGSCTGAKTAERQTKPPGRYAEGSIITAMKEAWRHLPEGELRERLQEAGGIGTPATRDQVIETLVRQGQIARDKGRFRPTETGFALWELLSRRAPALVDPGTTAAWEAEFDLLTAGDGAGWMTLVDRLAQEAAKAVEGIRGEGGSTLDGLDRGSARPRKGGKGGGKGGGGPASPKQLAFLRKLAAERGQELDGETVGKMTGAEASARIEELMKLPRTDGGAAGGGGGGGGASPKQLAFLRKLAAERGQELDEEAVGRLTGTEASARIEELMKLPRTDGGTAGGGDRAPSPGRLQYAEDLAGRHGVDLPKECRTDWRRTKAFIDKWSRR